jgi:hypothetical protein
MWREFTMEWKVLREEKPNKNCLCYVTNAKDNAHGCPTTVAYYWRDFDYFRCQKSSMPLEVTHYVVLPDVPPKEYERNL